MKDYTTLLKQCRLFDGIPEGSYHDVLRYLHGSMRSFRKGEIIMHIGDEFRYAGLVLEGVIECSYLDAEFNKYNMNHFSGGELFGESMTCAGVSDSPMQIMALTDCVVMFLDFRVLYDWGTKYEYSMTIAVNLIRIVSGQNFFMNQKVRILSRKTLRGKIITYLQSLRPDENGIITLPFTKTAMSEFLCVNRTALSRELRNMVHDGIITMDGRSLTLRKE